MNLVSNYFYFFCTFDLNEQIYNVLLFNEKCLSERLLP